LDLVEEDSVGHHLDRRCPLHRVGESDLVSHEVRDANFFGDSLGDRARRDASRLGVANPPVVPAAKLKADLW
jgi:hypothetical protein